MQLDTTYSNTQSSRKTLRLEQVSGGRVAAGLASLLLSPVFALNALASLIKGESPMVRRSIRDLAGRRQELSQFKHGFLKTAPVLWSIVEGKVSWTGMPFEDCDGQSGSDTSRGQMVNARNGEKPGLVSLFGLREMTGLAVDDAGSVLEQQASMSAKARFFLVLRYALALLIYRQSSACDAMSFNLFGTKINNVTMEQAASWMIASKRAERQANTACFVNVNSYNLAHGNKELTENINAMDRVFADGSGVRLAAKKLGVKLRDNVNGTDLLPILCDKAQRSGKSIYLLGAGKGVAKAAASELRKQFTQLKIAGYHHGYFDTDNCDDLINEINESGADIVLVGFGSPLQEKFLIQHRQKFQCNSLIAVGGLFDFFSGRIPRAPIWMRELGLEWVWRLAQEPRKKFNRYVVGNPLFLCRVLFQVKGEG